MALSLVPSMGRRPPLYGPMLRDRVSPRPPEPRLAIAVGFEHDLAWISAQKGELAIRKETRVAPHQTTIHLWHGTDVVVSMHVWTERMLVTRGSISVEVIDSGGCEPVRVVLSKSAAVGASLALETALERSPAGTPECSLHGTVELLRTLLAGGYWNWFLARESAWSRALGEVRPQLR